MPAQVSREGIPRSGSVEAKDMELESIDLDSSNETGGAWRESAEAGTVIINSHRDFNGKGER